MNLQNNRLLLVLFVEHVMSSVSLVCVDLIVVLRKMLSKCMSSFSYTFLNNLNGVLNVVLKCDYMCNVHIVSIFASLALLWK